MSGKREHGMGRRQYAQWRKSTEKQEESMKKSKCIQQNLSSQSQKEKSPTPKPAEPDVESTDSQELPDVPWASTLKERHQCKESYDS